MNNIDNTEVSNIKKQRGFLGNTIDQLEVFCSKLNKSNKDRCCVADALNNIKQLNLPENIQEELIAKFYTEEEEKFKYFKN